LKTLDQVTADDRRSVGGPQLRASSTPALVPDGIDSKDATDGELRASRRSVV
jgi:hypothetical protein